MLWCWDPRWPDLVHPFASAIDTELPVPPERTHLMLGSKAVWVVPQVEPNDKTFLEYPDELIAEWHECSAGSLTTAVPLGGRRTSPKGRWP